jgi:hypothetical protein
MPNLVEELNTLDFGIYLGGPLQAAIQAEEAASMAAVQFIRDVGFTKDDSGKDVLRYVDFEYKKSVPNPNFGSTASDLPSETNTKDPFIQTDVSIKFPFLTMLRVPSLRIDELRVSFNARLTSTETADVSSEFAASAELGINYKIVNFKASASYKRSSSRGEKVEKSYTLTVDMLARGDEMPEGMEKILTLLEDSIASR